MTAKITIRLLAFLFLFPLLTLMMSARDEMTEGKAVYHKKCNMCHGPDGKGETKAGKMLKVPDLTQLPWKHGSTLPEVEKVIREGTGKMPGLKGKLTDLEIRAVAKYAMDLCGVEVQE